MKTRAWLQFLWMPIMASMNWGRKQCSGWLRHWWAAGASFAFICYRHASQLILCQRGTVLGIMIPVKLNIPAVPPTGMPLGYSGGICVVLFHSGYGLPDICNHYRCYWLLLSLQRRKQKKVPLMWVYPVFGVTFMM